MQERNKSILTAVLVIIFVVYAAIQLTCNALAPERPAAESGRESH
jgi:hypothetical protein